MLTSNSTERLFELSRDMLAIASAQTGYWLRVNPAMTTVLGWSEEELLRMPFMDIVHPDDLRRSTAAVERLASGINLSHFEQRVLCSNGQYIWVEWQTGSYPAEALMYCCGREITERKQQEEWIKYLLQLSDVIRPLSNPDDVFAAITEAAKNYFRSDRCYYAEILENDFDIRRDAISGNLPSIVGKYRKDSFPLFTQIMNTGEPLVIPDVSTTEMIDRNLREQCLQLQIGSFMAIPVTKELKSPGILFVAQCTARDWTGLEIRLAAETAERTWQAVQRANAEYALFQSEQQLRGLLKQKDEFINIASHELKTPVTSIKAYAEIVLDRLQEMGDTQNAILLDRLTIQIDRMNKLIDHLLDTTKISEGQLILHPESIDINDLLKQGIEEIRHTSTHRIVFHPDPSAIVNADRERLQQAITNLLSNAIKYSPNNSTVIITSEIDAGVVAIKIKDEGVGILPENQQKIFDRFFRINDKNSTKVPGMGLGLFITSQIIQRHGGMITVESAPGKGSVFTFTLPYQTNPHSS